MNLPKTGKLGFGLMRLPKIGDEFDIEQTKSMIDAFMDAGFNYFDTAYVYTGSEVVTKEVLVDRYPRESYTLATKMNAHMGTIKNRKDCEDYFNTQLERTGAGYFDYYLMHAISAKENYEKYKELGLFDFAAEKKAQGFIKHNGFSFHGDPELLELILDEHPETEFVQLQINYIDWDSDMIHSGKLYEIAKSRNIPIIIMEPIKGGSLVNISDEAKAVFKETDDSLSAAAWALRFVGSLDGVHTVLSGMSTLEQTVENIEIFKDFKPMTEQESKTIDKAIEVINSTNQIPCTDCKYCVEGCPKSIDIPYIFKLANSNRRTPGDGLMRMLIGELPKESTADSCIACGKCEMVCPQHIPIIENLKEVATEFVEAVKK